MGSLSLVPSDLTGNYSLTEFWEPQINKVDFTAMLHLHGGRPLTAEIARVCNCAVYPNWEKRNVKIGANSRANIDRVLRKLRKIEELFVSHCQYHKDNFNTLTDSEQKRGFEPFSMILVHPEDKKKFEFKLVSLDKQGELERTTVFPHSSKWHGHPTSKLYLIRMMEYSPAKERFVPCPIEVGSPSWAADAEYGTGPSDWIGYTFNGWGSADMNPLLLTSRPGSDGGSDSEGGPDLTGFEPEDLVGQYNTPGGQLALSIFSGAEEASHGYQSTPAQFRADGGFSLGSRPLSVDDNSPAATRPTTGVVRVPRARAGKEPAAIENTRGFDDATTGYQTETSSHYNDLASLHVDSFLNNTANHSKGFSLSGASSADSDEFELGRRPVEKHLGTGIELSARPPPTVSSKFGGYSDRIVEPKEAGPTVTRTVRKPRERKPRSESETADESSGPSEKMEKISEMETRKVQRTMRQKAPSRKKLYDGNDESLRF